ncbi:MAG TPA: hypothetical protein VFQ61_08290, partial [Polyangiaceae bacterium]|nr:hypothetical protein [Polyangiaceae bacterium]
MKRLFRTAPMRTRLIPSVLLVAAWMASPLSVQGKPDDRGSAKAAPAQPKKADDAPVKSQEARGNEARAAGAKTQEVRKNAEGASSPGSLPEATGEPSLDPRRGQGARNVEIEPSPRVGKEGSAKTESGTGKAEPKETRAEAREKDEPSAGSKSAKGKANAKAPRSTPDMNQRRQIALGPTSEELAVGKEDPELRSLRDAELVLFPQPLPGLVPGWSWDLPQPSDGLPEIVSGAPLPAPAVVLPKSSSGSPEWLRSMSMPNLPVRLEDRVVRYLTFFRDSPSGRSIARAWVKKSGRYVAALRAELARNGLPT